MKRVEPDFVLGEPRPLPPYCARVRLGRPLLRQPQRGHAFSSIRSIKGLPARSWGLPHLRCQRRTIALILILGDQLGDQRDFAATPKRAGPLRKSSEWRRHAPGGASGIGFNLHCLLLHKAFKPLHRLSIHDGIPQPCIGRTNGLRCRNDLRHSKEIFYFCRQIRAESENAKAVRVGEFEVTILAP